MMKTVITELKKVNSAAENIIISIFSMNSNNFLNTK